MKEEILLPLRHQHIQEDFVGDHPRFIQLLEQLKNIACKNVSVLLMGETGTGKGRCVEFIHQYSNRFNFPFIPFNCGAGPESLFESQIFGHVKGAFTGAHKDRHGLIEEAAGGILFLDEINSLLPSIQVKLNQFLETGHFRRLGENRIRRSDVRVISASNVDLFGAVKKGQFREDLYFRLAEYEITVPPLRTRKEDVQLLVEYFIKKNSDLCSNNHIRFTPRAFKKLTEYDWPGNIRELENFVKRCLIEAKSNQINSRTLPNLTKTLFSCETEDLHSLPWRDAKKRIVSSFERDYLKKLLKKYHGVVAKCAKHAGIQPPDFWKLMRKYQLNAKAYKAT